MGSLPVWFAGAAAVFFGVLMTLQRSLYSAAVCLLAVLLQAAVLFYFCGAPLLAFLQVMIYAGAVMVLIVVTIMAAPSAGQRRWGALSIPKPLAFAGVAAPLIEIALILAAASPRGGLPAAGGALQSAMAQALFGRLAVATEAVTLLMFLSALALGRSEGEAGAR